MSNTYTTMTSTPELFKCNHCPYSSKYKGNLKRHINTVHSENKHSIFCDACDRTFVSITNLNRHILYNCKAFINNQNVEKMEETVEKETQNIKSSDQNVESLQEFKCPDCYKSFSRKNNLVRHGATCKHISHPFECPKCNRILPSRFAKSKHIKICVPPPKPKELIVFDPKNTLFDLSHISDEDIKQLIRKEITQDSYCMNKNIFTELSNLTLSIPTNRCVKKTNCRAVTSNVHIGNNEWVRKHDSEIYEAFVAQLSERFLERILKIEPKGPYIKKLDHFLNYMADRSYCNENKVISQQIKKAFKELVQRIKSTV